MDDEEILAILRRHRIHGSGAVSRSAVRVEVGKAGLVEIDEWVRAHGGSYRAGAPSRDLAFDERQGRPGRSVRFDRYVVPSALLDGSERH